MNMWCANLAWKYREKGDRIHMLGFLPLFFFFLVKFGLNVDSYIKIVVIFSKPIFNYFNYVFMGTQWVSEISNLNCTCEFEL